MNLYEAAAAINEAVDILREDNDLAARIAFCRARIAALKAAVELTQAGTSKRHTANLRILDAEFALHRINGETGGMFI